MRGAPLSERDLRMLELLGKGDSSKAIAKKLGYRPGTTRVYLHDLYRKIGVPNKTSAVIWYFDRIKAKSAPPPEPDPAPIAELGLEESVGDLALRTDLFTALGAMSTLLGAYGRMWQVATRLKGGRVDKATLERRAKSRQLWEALLRGDFAYGKKLFDAGGAGELIFDSPPDGALLALLLLLGGYSNAADRMVTELGRKRRAPNGIAVRDHDLLIAVRAVVNRNEREALARVNRFANDAAVPQSRLIALVALHHLAKADGDRNAATRAADTLWTEAETSLQHLRAMGERPFVRGAASSAGTKAGGRRKAQAATA
ncbi:MAG TPA: helix-turn-helix transcriptional regulator [Usitatibacter sp.]|nr:helix-turn-helix transcriptional regulator [Usitatibacter sp.]